MLLASNDGTTEVINEVKETKTIVETDNDKESW